MATDSLAKRDVVCTLSDEGGAWVSYESFGPVECRKLDCTALPAGTHSVNTKTGTTVSVTIPSSGNPSSGLVEARCLSPSEDLIESPADGSPPS